MRSDLLAKNEVELAKTLGVTTKWLNEVKRRPEMVAAVRDKIHTAAVYAMPDVLMEQIRVAEPHDVLDKLGNRITIPGDTKAARFVAEISGVIKQHGIQVNNNVISPTVTETLSDEDVIRGVETVMRRRIENKDREGPLEP